MTGARHSGDFLVGRRIHAEEISATDEHGFTRMSEGETNSSIFPNPCFIRVHPWLRNHRVNPWQKIRRAARRRQQIHAKEISATDGHG
jgi:hypothetical protein